MDIYLKGLLPSLCLARLSHCPDDRLFPVVMVRGDGVPYNPCLPICWLSPRPSLLGQAVDTRAKVTVTSGG